MGANLKRLLMIAVLGGVMVGTAAAGQPVSESRPVVPGAEVEVATLAGVLTIEGWSASTLEVTGTLGDGVEELVIEVDDDDGTVSIEVEYDENYHGRQEDDTDLAIKLPQGSPLSVETVSASIAVSGMTSGVELETVSGAISVDGRSSSLDIESVSGPVTVDVAPSGAEIESVSGRIEIASVMGDLEIENVSGTVIVNAGTLGETSFETVSGNIECSAIPGNGDVDMETMSGTIALTVDRDAAASYEISTFSGSIKSAIGPEPERTSKYTPGQELVFNTGPGGPNVSLTSFSGTIELMAR